eukprot:2049513-Pleurochrysis_carterae.AAC.1
MAPSQLTPKTLPQPARDTENAPERVLWRKNPISDESYDPAKCLETADAPDWIPPDTNTNN